MVPEVQDILGMSNVHNPSLTQSQRGLFYGCPSISSIYSRDNHDIPFLAVYGCLNSPNYSREDYPLPSPWDIVCYTRSTNVQWKSFNLLYTNSFYPEEPPPLPPK
uniref:Uncharacterized protein n=1 Tax=Cacopsylla melanoneura TaxID=428564 RepID=A0A8D8TZ57_9HEMI